MSQKNISDMLQKAVACHQAGDLRQAEEKYQLVLESEPHNPDALHMLGVISLQMEEIDKASELIDKAIESSQGFPELFLTRGDVYAAQEKLSDAISSYQKAIQLKPDLIEAYFNMGNTFYRMEEYNSAISAYESAINIKPDLLDALNNLGLTYHAQRNFTGAISCFNQALEIEPDNADVHNNLGNSLHDAGKANDAIRSYETASRLAPDHFDALYNLGNSYQEKGNFQQAVHYYTLSLGKNPNNPDVYINLGKAYHVQGDIDRAIETYEKAATLNHDTADLYFKMGNAFLDQSRIDEATRCYQKALSLDPEHSETYINLGNVFNSQHYFDKAISCYEKVIKIKPHSAVAYNNLGKLFEDQLDLGKAILYYQYALELEQGYAEAHFNYSTALLLSGNFKEGFNEYEWRFEKIGQKNIYPHDLGKPLWDGSPFRGKRLLVHAEQGLGDTIQFARYLPLVKARGGTVIFEVREPLHALLETCPGIDQLVIFSFDEKCSEPYDLSIPLMSLPNLFGTTPETIPNQEPFIHSTPERINDWRNKIGDTGFKVGIVWTGSPTNTGGHHRSCSLDSFAPLAEIQGVQLFGLQKQEAGVKLPERSEFVLINNFGSKFKDFADTAAAIENLDLVISIDTAVAHLAGAMGKPVWTLLPFSPDWRWLLNREDSPWYPTMRLFRQPEPGDWDSVFRQVEAELRRYC